MTRWWVLLSLVVLVQAQPAQAQTVPEPFDVVERLGPFIEADDPEGVYATLSSAVLAARETDTLSADWAFVFSLFSDQVRVYKNDPAYALRIADEGMDLLLQGNGPPDPQMIALLNWSRAYAMADLGRLAEAADIARLTAPQLRLAFDDKTADDFLATAKTWGQGKLTTLNSSAEVTAEAVAEKAYEAANNSDYGRALTLAAQATLPEGSGLPPAAVLRVNTIAAVVRGRALYQLDRVADAQVALLAAADALLHPGWRAGAGPLWRLDLALLEGRDWELFFWLARSAYDTEDFLLAERAATIAAPLSPTREEEQSTVFLRNALANAQGQFAQADAMLLDLAAKSRSEGDAHGAATAEFYVARNRAGRTKTWAEVDTAAMIRATDAAVAARLNDEALNADFFQVEAASYLVNTDAVAQGLAYARAGLAGWKARTANGTATEIETAGDQVHTRVIVDILLYGANRLAERDARAVCPGDTGTGCVIIVDFP